MHSGYLTSVPWRPGHRHAFPRLSVRLADAAEFVSCASELDWTHLGRVELGSLHDFHLTDPWRHRVSFRAAFDTEDFGFLLDHLDSLRAEGVELVLGLEDPALQRKATFAASLGVHVRVTLRPVAGDAVVVLNRLISYYLLGPAPRRAALEPFASLERELRSEQGGGLWVACEESVADHLYCDAEDVLALSARFAEAGHGYGPLGELANHGWERTPGFQALEGYQERLFRERAECAFCSAFSACRGWLRFLDATFDCSLWRLVLESFEEAMGTPPPPSRGPGFGPARRRGRGRGATEAGTGGGGSQRRRGAAPRARRPERG